MEQNQVRDFLTPEDHDAIQHAIRQAELRTSGEIRVRLDLRAGDDVKAAARRAFETLGMRKTALRNGVLFYLAVEDRKFVILGDDGIYHKVPVDFWDSVTHLVQEHFRDGRYTEGLVAGIEQAGEKLARYFPRADDDIDELPNEVSFG